MSALRRILLVAVGAVVLTMAVVGTATARYVPAAIQTTQYAWTQPPTWVGVPPAATWVPQSTAYVWAQPPTWIPITS